MKNSLLNNVKNRFISLPRSAVEGLEHEPKKSDFNFIKELGIGSFGTVYLVSHKKTKAKYALKAIDKRVPENLEEKESFNREVEIMYKLNHPNIVKLYGHFEDEQFCYFIMQYIPNKSVFNIIPKNGQQPNIKLVASVMKDLISAIYYMHNMKPTIIHRDIKPENILLDEKNKAYLTDFGWSNYSEKFIRRNTTCGTPLYLPPEMLTDEGHDETADLWCIGVLLFELLVGDTPFQGDDIDTVAYNICALNISWPRYMDPDAKDLISKILKFNGKDRLPILKILRHKFFTKFYPNAVNELIKPQNQKNKIFVISVDDPKTFGTENKISQNKTNIRENSSIKINTSKNINNKTNKGTILAKTKTMYAPIIQIDLSKSSKGKDKKSLIKRINNNRFYTTNNCNDKYKTKNIPSPSPSPLPSPQINYGNNYNNSFVAIEYRPKSPTKNNPKKAVSPNKDRNYSHNNFKYKTKIKSFNNSIRINNDNKPKNNYKINNSVNVQNNNYNNNSIYYSYKTLTNNNQTNNPITNNNRISNSIKETNKFINHLRNNTQKNLSYSFINNTSQNTSKINSNNYSNHNKVYSSQNPMMYSNTNNNNNDRNQRKISINNNISKTGNIRRTYRKINYSSFPSNY